MSKKIAISLLSFCFVLSVVGMALSQDAPAKAPTKAPAAPTAPQDKQLLGEVVKVDVKTKTLVVRTQDGEKTFDAAKATFSGYQKIADIKSGDKVAILYQEKGGKLTAKLVANHAAMMKAPPAPGK